MGYFFLRVSLLWMVGMVKEFFCLKGFPHFSDVSVLLGHKLFLLATLCPETRGIPLNTTSTYIHDGKRGKNEEQTEKRICIGQEF